MTGSLHIKSGIYYVVLNTYEDGKRKQKWINTNLPAKGNKRQAEELLTKYRVEYKAIQEEQAARQNTDYMPYFYEYIEEWLESRKDKVEWSTWESYETYVKVHLVPYFKKLNLRLNEVSPRHIKNYYEFKYRGGRKDSKDGGLSIASIKKHGSVMKMVFKEAAIIELINRNPADIVPLPRQESGETKAVFLNTEQANALLASFRGHELQPLVYVTLYYGLRRSEVLGLKWNAVDFDQGTVEIRHTVVKHKKIVAKDKTKSSASKATYQLLPEVRELLLKLKEEQKANRKVFGRAYYQSDYIFVHPDGSLRRPDCVTRGFQRVVKNNGLTPMRFHDLRHPYVKPTPKIFFVIWSDNGNQKHHDSMIFLLSWCFLFYYFQ